MSEQSLVERLLKMSGDLNVWQLDDAERLMYDAADRIAQLEAQLSNSETVAWMAEDGNVLSAHDKKNGEWRNEVWVQRYSQPLFAAPVADNTAGEDAARLDWMQRKLTGASDSARYLPFRVYWGQSKNIRAAIDKARGVQQEGGKAE